MRQAEVHRPVTVERVASAIGLKPFELLRVLIFRQILVAPHQQIEDSVAIEVAADEGVDLKIVDEGNGSSGSSPLPKPMPPAPPNPMGLSSHNPYPDRNQTFDDKAR